MMVLVNEQKERGNWYWAVADADTDSEEVY